MLEERYAPLMYLPFATAGFARITLEITAVALSTSLSAVNEILPTGTCTNAVLSVRNSTLPALISFTALAMSKVTVPVLGFGIRPLGPSTLPSLPTDFIMSGVEITASKSVQPSFWIFSTISSPPTKSAPAACASRTFSPLAITRTFFDLPSPCGSTTVPRTIWSACLGSTPSRIVTSTVSSNLANFTFCSSGTASSSLYGRGSTAARDFVMFFPGLRAIATPDFCLPPLHAVPGSRGVCDSAGPGPQFRGERIVSSGRLRDHVNPHRTRRALHALDGGIERGGVQGGHLLLHASCCFFCHVLLLETRNSKLETALRHFLHLPKLQLHRSGTSEDRDHDFQCLAVFVHLVHYAGKGGERALGDAHVLVLLELDLELRLVF